MKSSDVGYQLRLHRLLSQIAGERFIELFYDRHDRRSLVALGSRRLT